VTIVVSRDEKGNYVFASSRGAGAPEEERKKALQIDDLVKKTLGELEARLKKSGLLDSTIKVEAYWEFGACVRKLMDLVEPAEVRLFWQNVEMNANRALLAENRGPNRNHVAYCLRLAGYPKELALRREWSEWVFIFDSPSVNQESRFDEWDRSQLTEDPSYAFRRQTRAFIQCLNAVLRKVETKELSKTELERCYEGSRKLAALLLQPGLQTGELGVVKERIRKARPLVSDLMSGVIESTGFAHKILSG
jgi:hypothetical protein